MRKGNKLLIMLFAFFVTLTCMRVCAYAEENKKLSELSEEECIEFLKMQGTEIPKEYIDYTELGSTVKEMIMNIEAHPEAEGIYNYTAKAELYANVRETVLKYYEIKIENNSFISAYSTKSALTLQYSKALYSWNEIFKNYNCYGFAINVNRWINPGYTLGVDYGANTVNLMSLSRMADLVASDLSELGYTNITYGRTRPSYQSGYKVIAVRKSSDDFHFMAETSVNVWRHKPGDSVELQYNYSSPTSGKWTNEGIGRYGLQGGGIEYNSDIVYIKYKLK